MFTMQKGRNYINNIVLGNLKKKHKKHIVDIFSRYGKEIKEALVKVITTGSRSGIKYFYRGVSYIASAPGEPPANRSGLLADSFGFDARDKELVLWNEAVSERGAPYPFFLEGGTNKMAARPYFVNTIEKYEGQIRKELESLKDAQ